MWIDSEPQPCSRCQRSIVLATFTWGRQWLHLGTWSPQCDPPMWARAEQPHLAFRDRSVTEREAA